MLQIWSISVYWWQISLQWNLDNVQLPHHFIPGGRGLFGLPQWSEQRHFKRPGSNPERQRNRKAADYRIGWIHHVCVEACSQSEELQVVRHQSAQEALSSVKTMGCVSRTKNFHELTIKGLFSLFFPPICSSEILNVLSFIWKIQHNLKCDEYAKNDTETILQIKLN